MKKTPNKKRKLTSSMAIVLSIIITVLIMPALIFPYVDFGYTHHPSSILLSFIAIAIVAFCFIFWYVLYSYIFKVPQLMFEEDQDSIRSHLSSSKTRVRLYVKLDKNESIDIIVKNKENKVIFRKKITDVD